MVVVSEEPSLRECGAQRKYLFVVSACWRGIPFIVVPRVWDGGAGVRHGGCMSNGRGWYLR